MADPEDIDPDDIKTIPTFRAAYSDRTALLMARLSRRAYEHFDKSDAEFANFTKGFETLGLSPCVKLLDPEAGTAGYIVASPELVAVVFRGTEDELDWRTNFRLEFVTLQGGARVHAGFFLAYMGIRKDLFREVKELIKAKSRPVYVAGHSLGGAIAMMATAEMSNDEDRDLRDSIAAVYTFGAPKAGDRSFDQYVKVPLYRVTNGIDIVPAVPPWFGYRQVGDTRYYGKLGVAPLRRAPRLYRQILRSFRSLLNLIWTGQIANITDHEMRVYIQKLHEWTKANLEETQKRRAATADPEIK